MEHQNVTIKSIDMSMWNMCVFMVKWAIAAIPAAIILVIIGTVFAGVLAGIGAGTSGF